MPRRIDWDRLIGRRLKLRDLHLFFAVVQHGSMAKAASYLGISQPAVSEVVAELEHTLGVRLFDRSARGVELTIYGRALFRRSEAAFDELKQGIRDIAFLTEPSVGEVRVGCPESIAASILPACIKRLLDRYPGIALDVTQVGTAISEYPELQARKLDLVIARVTSLVKPGWDVNLRIEKLFDDKLVLATGARSRLAKRRSIKLSDLTDAKWLLTPPGTNNHDVVAAAFAAQGLSMPRPNVMTYSIHLRTHLLAEQEFVAALPKSTLRLNAERFHLKELPIELPARPWPVAIVTLRNRTLSPVVERFIECVRDIAKTISDAGGTRTGRRKR